MGIFSALAAIGGGLIGARSNRSINSQNVQAQEQANMQNFAFLNEQRQHSEDFAREMTGDARANSDFWNRASLDFSRRQFGEQRDQARYGISRKVEDARRAGLHPLFALGGATGGGSPVNFIAGQAPTGSAVGSAGPVAQAAVRRPDNALGRGLTAAALAYQDRKDKQYARKRQKQLDARTIRMDNAALRKMTAEANESEARARLADSNVKRAEQEANYTRPPIALEAIPPLAAHGQTHPLGVRAKPQDLVAAVDKMRSSRGGFRPFWSEEKWGELGQFVTAMFPWITSAESIFTNKGIATPRRKWPRDRSRRDRNPNLQHLRSFDR